MRCMEFFFVHLAYTWWWWNWSMDVRMNIVVKTVPNRIAWKFSMILRSSVLNFCDNSDDDDDNNSNSIASGSSIIKREREEKTSPCKHSHRVFENPLVKYVLYICMYLFMYGNFRALKIVSVRISNGFPLSYRLQPAFLLLLFSRFLFLFFLAFRFSRQSVECVAWFLFFCLLFLLLLFCFFFLLSSLSMYYCCWWWWLVRCFVRSFPFV